MIQQMTPYSTNLPLLCQVVSGLQVMEYHRHPHSPNIRVLELGSGFYSTPVLAQMLRGHTFVSIERNLAWLEMIRRAGFVREPHQLVYVSEWSLMKQLDEHWDLVFVDCEPMSQRAWLAEAFFSKAKMVVFHDTESPASKGCEEVLAKFSYRFDYKLQVPWTTVVSNVIDVERFCLERKYK